MLGEGVPPIMEIYVYKNSPINQDAIPIPRKNQTFPIVVENLYIDPKIKRNVAPKAIAAIKNDS